jgi:hypothetical protein
MVGRFGQKMAKTADLTENSIFSNIKTPAIAVCGTQIGSPTKQRSGCHTDCGGWSYFRLIVSVLGFFCSKRRCDAFLCTKSRFKHFLANLATLTIWLSRKSNSILSFHHSIIHSFTLW